METTARATDLMTLNSMLRTQRTQRHDVVQPAAHFRAQDDGTISVLGDQPFLTLDGVRTARYRAGEVLSDGISSRLGIPRKYLRKMAEKTPDLWARNVNAWLQHEDNAGTSFLLRTLRDEETGEAFGRALLSDTFDRSMENLDVLVAAMQGVRESGHAVEVDRCDLSERHMFVTLHAPDIDVEAAGLLAGYRSPFEQEDIARSRRVINQAQADAFKRDGDPDGTAAGEGTHRGFYDEGTEPIVFGGIEIRNSDVGCGAFDVSPKLRFLRCTNGMTVPASMVTESLRKIHRGSRHDSGVVRDSKETVLARLGVIKRETIDAVQHFLSVEFVAGIIAELEEKATTRLKKPEETIKVVTKDLAYSDDIAADLFAHFIAGGQPTAGGVMHAMTSVAQTVADPERAAHMEAHAIQALELAVANA